MNTYDEKTHELIEDPDLENGYVYPGQILKGYTEERHEYLEGTEHLNPPNGYEHIIPPQPIYEDCYFYHKYVEGEKPTPAPTSDAVYDEMAKAYKCDICGKEAEYELK